MDLALHQPVDLATLADPIESAIVTAPRLETHFFGLNQRGQLYLYGDTPDKPRRVIDEASGLAFVSIQDCRVSLRANGQNEYLDLTLQSATPNTLFVLALRSDGSKKSDGSVSTQWSVRSLLGALCSTDLDLQDRAGIVTARRGTGGNGSLPANFIDLFLEPTPGAEFQQVFADAIDGDRNSLEIAVNRVRRALNLEPQFP